MTRFWMVRHGPTHAKGMVGWTDLPADLSDTQQIERLSRYLPKTARLISSDLLRTTQTADVLAEGRTRLPPDPDLREINFGAWEMKDFATIEAEYPDLIRAFWDQPGDVRAPLGDSWNDVCGRVNAAVDRLIPWGGDIIIVAHFGVIVTQIQRANGLTAYQAFGHRIDNLSVTEIQFDGAWHMGKINHLP